MEKTIKRIWDYIDSQMDKDQKSAFEDLMENDAEVKMLYEKHMDLHKQLKSIPPEQAPVEMSQNVLKAIGKKTSYLAMYDSFLGLKFIFGFLFLAGVSIVLGLSLSGETTGEPNQIITAVIDLLSFDFSLGKVVFNLLPYCLVILSILFLIWVDNFIQKTRVQKVFMY